MSGHTLCEVTGYNGTDAEVIIPDKVPDNYFDEAQRGNTVTGIEHNAFKDNTTVISVTAGDGLRIISESAFEGCTSLKAVTIGNSLESIGTDAFKSCTSLESFTSTSMEVIACFSRDAMDPGDPELPPVPAAYSFEKNTTVTFYGPHDSALLDISNDYTSSSFVPTDKHENPTWTWAADYSSATAVFDCNHTCKLIGGDNAEFTDNNIKITQGDNGTVYTASVTVDGETYTDTTEHDYFLRHSLTLHGDISVNFYLSLTEEQLAQNPTVSFVLNGKSLPEYTIDVNEPYTIDNMTLYKASCWVCAPEMADTIFATLKFGEKEVATDIYSVKAYAQAIFADANQPDDLKALVGTMVNYGAANLANEGIDYALKQLTDAELNAIDAQIPDKDAINDKLSGTGLSYYGCSMLLHSKTILRFYFQKDDPNDDVSKWNVKLGENELKQAEGFKDAEYFAYIEVEGIPAYELNNTYTLSFNGTELGSYSALSYVKDVLTYESDTTLRDTVTAMYRYHQAAVTYFNNHNG